MKKQIVEIFKLNGILNSKIIELKIRQLYNDYGIICFGLLFKKKRRQNIWRMKLYYLKIKI